MLLTPLLTCLAPVDIKQTSSQNTREDTAELASWALSERVSAQSAQPPAQHQDLVTTNDKVQGLDPTCSDHRDSEGSSRPDVIDELSEPASPRIMHLRRKSAKVSALSEMFREPSSTKKQCSDTDETDETDEEGGVTRRPSFGAVTVQEGIISQPTEATALLLKKAAHGSDSQKYGSVPDIESQRGHRKSSQAKIRHFPTDLKDQGISVARRFLLLSSWDRHKAWNQVVRKPASYVPPVMLGLLLNILDALSYGMKPC